MTFTNLKNMQGWQGKNTWHRGLQVANGTGSSAKKPRQGGEQVKRMGPVISARQGGLGAAKSGKLETFVGHTPCQCAVPRAVVPQPVGALLWGGTKVMFLFWDFFFCYAAQPKCIKIMFPVLFCIFYMWFASYTLNKLNK